MISPRGIDISSELAELARSRMREVKSYEKKRQMNHLKMMVIHSSTSNLPQRLYHLNKKPKLIIVYAQKDLFNVTAVAVKHNLIV